MASTNENGTTGDGDDPRFFIRVAEHMPSLEECYAFCAADPSCGAVASFVGITRHDFQGRRVTKLTYEGYVPMAVKELRALCLEALADTRFASVTRIAAVHRLGDCPVGMASAILVAASPHRRDALRCTEFLIDALKARVPIWKLEVYENDPSVWKENIEWHEGKARRVMTKQEPSS
jgi:molybdopterin synthase catalytic subunit